MRLKKKANHNVNHELQMFFEELSRIKVDVLANCENLEAIIGWMEHMEIPQDKKQHMIKELSNAHKQFKAMCEIAFKDSDNTVSHVLSDIVELNKENNQSDF